MQNCWNLYLACKQQPLIIGTFEKRAPGPIFPNYGALALLWPQLFEVIQ